MLHTYHKGKYQVSFNARPPTTVGLVWSRSAVGAAGIAEADRRATQRTHQAEKSRQQALATTQPQRAGGPRVQAERRGAQAY